MDTLSAPDKHHYLPVFYLSQWAAPDGKVIRYHRPVSVVVAHPIAPKNTGFERGLYRLDGYASEQSNAIETGFMSAVVDNEGAQAMQVLTAGDLGRMTPELGRAWVRFIMAMHVRHPARVEQITEQVAEMTRQSLMSNPEEYEALRKPNDPPTLLAYVEQKIPELITNRGKQFLPGIISHETIGEIVRHMKWQTVEILHDDLDFLTCDRPLHMSHGISDDRCFIAVPMSPRIVFLATRDADTFKSVLGGGIEAFAKSLNEVLVSQADKYVYAAHDRHSPLVEKLLGKATRDSTRTPGS
jgi:hypothetical protein